MKLAGNLLLSMRQSGGHEGTNSRWKPINRESIKATGQNISTTFLRSKVIQIWLGTAIRRFTTVRLSSRSVWACAVAQTIDRKCISLFRWNQWGRCVHFFYYGRFKISASELSFSQRQRKIAKATGGPYTGLGNSC